MATKRTADLVSMGLTSWICLIPVFLYLFGLAGLLIFLGGILSVAIYFLASAVISKIRKNWNLYKTFRDKEAQEIIRRLQGQR